MDIGRQSIHYQLRLSGGKEIVYQRFDCHLHPLK